MYLFIYVEFFLRGSACHMAYGILVPRAGIKPIFPAVEARNPNHWTIREVQHCFFSHFSVF